MASPWSGQSAVEQAAAVAERPYLQLVVSPGRWAGVHVTKGVVNLSGPARQAVTRAEQEARRLGNHYLGTEHLLLGLVAGEADSGSRMALEVLGVSLEAVVQQVDEIIGTGERSLFGFCLVPFTPGAIKVLRLARREALRTGCTWISTEHLLVALIREGEGVAAHVLLGLGADTKQARLKLRAAHTESGGLGSGLALDTAAGPGSRDEILRALARRDSAQ